MARFARRYHPPGTSPGTLPPPLPGAAGVRIRVMDFDESGVEEADRVSPEECSPYMATARTTWIDVCGAADPDVLRTLGETFGLHPLALEDVANIGQRPKAEAYEDTSFVILNDVELNGDGIERRQVSLFLKGNTVIVFHPARTDGADPFEPVRRRLRAGTGRLHRSGAGYLLYALVDLLIDRKFPVVEALGDRIEDLEERLLAEAAPDVLERIHTLKRTLVLLRRQQWAEREAVGRLTREEMPGVSEDTRLYLRDCHDHAVQILELVESYREMTTDLMELHLSSVSNRLNEVMRVLTVVSTIFLPLFFLTGVYGMNFDREASPWSMPELGWYFGYPAFWLLVLTIAGVLLALFRWRRWL